MRRGIPVGNCASTAQNGEVIGVLDIDSPEVGRFSAEDEEGLREVVRILERIIVCS